MWKLVIWIVTHLTQPLLKQVEIFFHMWEKEDVSQNLFIGRYQCFKKMKKDYNKVFV